MRKIELTGTIFGRLKVIKEAPRRKNRIHWHCKCACGNTTIVQTSDLRTGHTKSCGCFIKENPHRYKHGHKTKNKTTPEYRAWVGIKKRCYNKKNHKYYRYGARGIIVCERWRNSFLSFLGDVGFRPSNKHSIGRMDNNGNYEPNNVEWQLPIQQMNNKSNNHFIVFNNQKKTIAQWSREFNINAPTIRHRIKAGWPVEKALTTPTK